MTVAVSCNLADGVVLGVDSAVTLGGPEGVLKVYEHAEKLFQLGEKPIGIASFGIGNIGTRSIGSYIREFEITNPKQIVTRPCNLAETVEALRLFFFQKYKETIIPAVESQTKKKFEEIPDNQKPVLGLVVGGFSNKEYLSEVWEIFVPFHQEKDSARLCRKKGSFGGNWFALYQPIARYVKGVDFNLLMELRNYFMKIRGSSFTPEEDSQIVDILKKHEYQIPFMAMPIEEGVAHVRFLVEMVVNHYRFVLGAPVVGGKAHIGVVTYKGEKFQIIE